MYENEEYVTSHLESSMEDEDQQVLENVVCRTKNGKEPFAEYSSIGSLEHKVLYAPDKIRDDLSHGFDPISAFTMEKKNFVRGQGTKLLSLKRNNLLPSFYEFEENVKSLKSDRCLRVPSAIPKFLRSVRHDPDMYYFGKYNWYYTGGTLQTVNNKGGCSLLFVEKADKDNLCVAPLHLDNSQYFDSSRIHKVVPSDGQEIFQVVGVENSNLVGTRQKYNCTVFSVASKGRHLIKECFKSNSESPFVGFDISSVYNELCTFTAKGSLTIWDMKEERLPINICYLSDNSRHDKWHSLWYSLSSPCEIVIACRKVVKWFDKRTKDHANTLDLRCISGREDDEEISLHFQSKNNSNGIYIGTNVSLSLMDVRMLEAPVHNWSHRLTLPPLYSSIISLSDSREIACIGNHYPGEVVLAFSTPDLSYPLVEIPSRMESLLRKQSEGKCLDPSLEPRLAPGLSGLTSFSHPESLNATILTQSRTSDIFSQDIFRTNSNASSELEDFDILITKEDKLNVSERQDMSTLYNGISDFEEISVKKSSKVRRTRQKKQKWQRSLAELKNYKDALSSVILDEWDSLIEKDEKQIEHIEKVSAWLNSCPNDSVQSGSSK